MNTDELCRLRMPEEKEEALCKYIADRRYVHMMTLYLSLAGSVILAPFAIMEWNGLSARSHKSYYYRRRYARRGSIVGLWIFAIATFIVMFIKGIGSVFGRNSDYDCVKRRKYAFGTMTVGGKKHDLQRHPYYVSDRDGNEYCCPVFLDYKNAQFGDTMFCVVLDNGKRFAMRDVSKPGWDLE